MATAHGDSPSQVTLQTIYLQTSTNAGILDASIPRPERARTAFLLNDILGASRGCRPIVVDWRHPRCRMSKLGVK